MTALPAPLRRAQSPTQPPCARRAEAQARDYLGPYQDLLHEVDHG